jgi:hypothetical protein
MREWLDRYTEDVAGRVWGLCRVWLCACVRAWVGSAAHE